MEVNKPLAPWEVLEGREIFAAPPWIKLSRQRIRLPDGRVIDDFHYIHLTDYALVVAQVPNGRFIMERQYKHGVGKVCLTLPAGGITAGEDPLRAAQRELLEETGYEAGSWQCLGRFACNANYGCGNAHIFTCRNARKIAEPDSGDLEEMEIVLLEEEELRRALCDGGIAALGAAAAVALALKDRHRD
ncbi:MAG: NUDIX hydrolase [Verrucomicrobia bacterium]|nr:NUDIX hydrolase [Verrucomicrobiota bacterium]